MGMRDGICSECGAAEVYRKPRGVGVSTSSGLEVSHWKTFTSMTVGLTAYICGRCGHTAFQVEREDLALLREILAVGGWIHVPPGKRTPD
jgi:ribosomal protein L37E